MCLAETTSPLEIRYCSSHSEICLGYPSSFGFYKACPVCQDNKMYEFLEGLGLPKTTQSKIMDAIDQLHIR